MAAFPPSCLVTLTESVGAGADPGAPADFGREHIQRQLERVAAGRSSVNISGNESLTRPERTATIAAWGAIRPAKDDRRRIRSSTGGETTSEPTENLMELVFLALDHGIDSVRSGSPLIPFFMTEGDEKKLQRFAAERLEEGVAKAQEAASSLDAATQAYAIAHDGYITVEGTKYDAILVEAAERGSPTGFVFAQRCRPKKGLFRGLKTIGNVALLGEAEQRFD